jgi:hypothetical protein
MLKQLGEFMGTIIVILYSLTILNYIVKFINKKYRTQLMKNEVLYKYFMTLMKFVIQKHKLFGLLTILFILLHFTIQFNQYGLNIPGVIAACIMLLQVGLGIYGSITKKRSKPWLMVHRTIATVLLITIIIHVV